MAASEQTAGKQSDTKGFIPLIHRARNQDEIGAVSDEASPGRVDGTAPRGVGVIDRDLALACIIEELIREADCNT